MTIVHCSSAKLTSGKEKRERGSEPEPGILYGKDRNLHWSSNSPETTSDSLVEDSNPMYLESQVEKSTTKASLSSTSS